MDVTTLTDEELEALVSQVQQERTKRTKDTELRDAAFMVVAEAKKHGYTREQVVDFLTKVVKQTYGG